MKNDLPFSDDEKIKRQTFSEEDFFRLKKPDYTEFDDLFSILKKKILIKSDEDIKIWEDDFYSKIEKSILNLDKFLEKVCEFKDSILIELRKHYYEGLLEEINYTDIQSYLASEYFDSVTEIFKKGDKKRFVYESYVSDKYYIYHVLTKKGDSKFLLILGIKETYDMQQKGVIDFRKQDTRYFRLNLTKEYKEYYNII